MPKPNYTTHSRHQSLASYARAALQNQRSDKELNPREYRASESYHVKDMHDDVQKGRYNKNYLDMLQGAVKQLAPSGLALKPTITHGVVGCAPSIGRYVQGNPRNMFKRVQSDKPAKVIKIAVCLDTSANIDAEQITNRAAAILSVISKYDLQGVKTHVDLFSAIPDTPSMSGCQDCELHTITVKRTNERLVLAQLTYLCDERLQRGLCFTFSETSPHNEGRNLTGNGYGYPQEFEALAGYDVCFRPIMGSKQGALYATPQIALKTITEIVVAQTRKETKAA